MSLHNNRLNGILADEMGLGKNLQVCYIIMPCWVSEAESWGIVLGWCVCSCAHGCQSCTRRNLLASWPMIAAWAGSCR